MARLGSLLSSTLSCLALISLALAPPARPKEAKEGWPSISREELALKDNPANPGASAMLLYREVSIDDVHRFETHYNRIKIFTDEGKKYADIEIPYLEHQVQVEDIQARTVHPDGSTADFQGQVFDRVVVKAKKLKFQAKTFTLPDVRAGGIIEYSFKLHWRDSPPEVLTNPGRYIITGTMSIPSAHWVVQHELFTRRAHFSIRPIPTALLAWTWMGLPANKAPLKQPDGTVQLDVENIPAFQEEEYMPPEEILKSRVNFSYMIGLIPSPESFWKMQAKDEGETTEKFIGNSKAIRHAVQEIVSSNHEPEAKLRKLYARVQQIRYLSFESFKTQKEEKRENLKENKNAEDILKHGYASANEINFLFVAMARAAGFKSFPVLVTSRDRNFFQRNELDRQQLNSMVVWVRLGSRDVYFDPATRYCPYNLLPWNETAATGIMLGNELDGQGGKASRKNGTQPSLLGPGEVATQGNATSDVLVTTSYPSSADAVKQRKALLDLDAEGNLQGKVEVSFTGQEALRRRIENRDNDEAGRRKEMEDELKGWLPPSATVELKNTVNWEKSEEPLYAEFSIKVPSMGSLTGRRLILPLALFQTNKKYPFNPATRVHPVYFHYPFQEFDDVTIQPAAGYRVESLPAPRNNPTSFGRYELSVEDQAGKVHLKRRFIMDGFLFPVKDYPYLRAFYEAVRAGDGQQAVLKVEEAGQAK